MVSHSFSLQVNNAGTGHMTPFEETTLDQLGDLYNIHVRAVFDLTQKAMPHLLKTKGQSYVRYHCLVF